MITAMNVPVAFHTMCQTTGMSPQWMTPASKATHAPMTALQPMPRPRGCQMTRTNVARKIRKAVSMGQGPVRCGIAGTMRRSH